MAEAARKGSEAAREALEGPEPPEAMLYLLEWAYALCGRSGASMDGMAPLSYTTLEAWTRMMDLELTTLEVTALIALDAVIRKPERDEPEPEVTAPENSTPWPESK